MSYLRAQLDAGQISGVAFLDLRKAFDMVNHFVFNPSVLYWFQSYLSDRSQFVKLNGAT